jgi:hypothetical protein
VNGIRGLTRSSHPFTAAHIGHYLLARRDKLPISKFATNDLRRTVATMLAEMGVALDLVAAVVGHESGGRETRTLVIDVRFVPLLKWSWFKPIRKI